VAAVLARAQEAVARARRLTASFQERIEQPLPPTSARPVDAEGPSSTSIARASSGTLPDTLDQGADVSSSSPECSPGLAPVQQAAAERADAAGQLVQRLMALPLLSATQKLAQLHNQQACTLRQLLELRVDQMRCAPCSTNRAGGPAVALQARPAGQRPAAQPGSRACQRAAAMHAAAAFYDAQAGGPGAAGRPPPPSPRA
jgi:hypothetical protein